MYTYIYISLDIYIYKVSNLEMIEFLQSNTVDTMKSVG